MKLLPNTWVVPEEGTFNKPGRLLCGPCRVPWGAASQCQCDHSQEVGISSGGGQELSGGRPWAEL